MTLIEGNLTNHKLRQKLARLEALEEGASTAGERIAAQHAKKRIQQRLLQSSETEFWKEDNTSSVEDVLFNSETPPTRLEVIEKLKHWQNDNMTQKDVMSWARNLVDKVFFDEIPPEHPDSIPIEIIMVCSAMDRRRWSKHDIVALMEFATSAPEDPLHAWKQWFAHVEVHF